MTVVAVPYGRDTSALDVLRPGRVVDGAELVGEAAYRRLITRRGTLLDDPTYGLALIDLLGADIDPDLAATFPGQIRGELLKDPRLDSAEVSIVQTGTAPSLRWDIEITGVTSLGDSFTLVLAVADVTLELLRLEAA